MTEQDTQTPKAPGSTPLTVLVTGAAGGLGSVICKSLSNDGYRVRALIRPEDSRAQVCVPTEDLWVGYIEDPAVVAKAMNGADVVINCAALLPNAAHLGLEAFLKVNVEGAVNILRQAAINRLGKAIFFSTISVVDHVHRRIQWSEIEQYVAGSPRNPYLTSKIEMEKALRRECASLPIQVRVLRPGFVYGPGNFTVWRDSLVLLQQGKMRLLDGGKAALPLISATDIAAFVNLLLKSEDKTRYALHILASREHTTLREIYDVLADKMHVSRPGSLPSWILYAMAIVAERLPEFCRRGRLSLLTTARVAQYSRGYDITGVLEPAPLGFIPQTGYREGLALMTEDYLSKEAVPGNAR